jgi:23S rRNA (guanosine2251-2'-O)-methyltransferase
VHQGIVVVALKLDDFNIGELSDMLKDKDDCHVLILDQVTDPQNVGAIIRSSVAFDTTALIMQDKNSPLESGAMDKAAAGMIEHLPIVRVTNLSRAIERLKKEGFWIVGMDGYAKMMISELKKGGKIAIVMGSEGKGMRHLIEENCDIAVKLPISEKTESLNVATAAAIALYEISQKK